IQRPKEELHVLHVRVLCGSKDLCRNRALCQVIKFKRFMGLGDPDDDAPLLQEPLTLIDLVGETEKNKYVTVMEVCQTLDRNLSSYQGRGLSGVHPLEVKDSNDLRPFPRRGA